MPAGGEALLRESWAESVRRAPAGILVLGVALTLLGLGFVGGGLYLGLTRDDAGWVALAAGLLVGPVLLYLSLHLVRLTAWAWLAVVILLALLFASSVTRALSSPEAGLSPIGEIVVEVGFLLYLWSPGVRRAFGRG